MKIELKFRIERSKIITEVKLKKELNSIILPYKAIFDPGSTMTTMSESLFNTLGFNRENTDTIKIIGVNSESGGFSTVIDYFEIGGINLGMVRVAVGSLAPQFQNNIIIGMNLLLWYDFALSHFTKKITLVERQLKNFDMSSRFVRKDIANINLLVDNEKIENTSMLSFIVMK